MLPRHTERMAGISELSRAQNLASLEHQLRPVRQCPVVREPFIAVLAAADIQKPHRL